MAAQRILGQQVSLTKRCPRCQQEKPRDAYGLRKRATVSGAVKMQLRSRCRECEKHRGPLGARREQEKAWKAANPEKVREKTRRYRKSHPSVAKKNNAKYRAKNRDAILAKDKSARAENPEHYKQRAQNYYAKNPEKFQVWRHNRRARLAKALRTLTVEQWEAILELHSSSCAYCGRADTKITMDHVLPLSRGGNHTAENVVPACRGCNASKNDKTLEEWRGATARTEQEN